MIKMYADYMGSTPGRRHEHFMQTLSKTNRTPEYYVNWDKVRRQGKRFELELHTLEFLIGKSNIRQHAKRLFTQQPDLLKAIPSLIASRDQILDILSFDAQDSMEFYQLDFTNIDSSRISDYLDFTEEVGLLEFLQNDIRRSLVDFVYGIEAGLDSNARKNRSGTTMEGILNRAVTKASKVLNFQHISQVSAVTALYEWGITIPVDKSARRFDEGIFDPKSGRAWLLETNYYGGGGSKLKSVAGEFMTLNQLITNNCTNITFIWVTDGQGWRTASIPLLEAFGSIPNIFNLEMLRQDFLVDALRTLPRD